MSKLYYMLPVKWRKPADRIKKKLLNFGFNRYCPVCRSHVRQFMPYGDRILREGVMCPVCNSFERHRFFWIYLKDNTNLLDGTKKKFLHIAPEKGISQNLERISCLEYLSADIDSPLAMVKMDITDIRYADKTFDVIYCSHVLEHIADDKKALSELYRVLKQDGWMLLAVPINEELETTDEDLALTDPQERLKRFGNIDHKRNYGKDFIQVVQNTGFAVTKHYPLDMLSKQQLEKYGISNHPVFICKK